MHDKYDNSGTNIDQLDLSDLEQVDPHAVRSDWPGVRFTILAGLTLGSRAAVVVGRDIITVVSHQSL